MIHKATFLIVFHTICVAVLHAQNFIEVSKNTALDVNGGNYGVSFADIDNDGDDDLFISRTNNSSNLLFENREGIFVDITSSAKIFSNGNSRASLWADFNNDGYIDVYIANRGTSNKMYYNNGDKTFTDVTFETNTYNASTPVSLAAGDLNNDGWLDIYIANLLEENVLFLNNGDGSFQDFTQSSGALDTKISMGAMLFDYDNDGDLDIYLSHDGNQPNILYQNDGQAVFTDVSEASGANYAGNGMGVDFADFNHDGWLDIYITNLYENTLLLNNGDGTFDNVSENAGVEDFGMGWGTNCFDYNNDGWADIYVVNETSFSPFPNVLYRNNGNMTFTEVSKGTVMASNLSGYGSAFSDIDLDGDLELVVANLGSNGTNQLFLNENHQFNWIALRLSGSESNKSAIGTRCEIYYDGSFQIDEVAAGTGYSSQNTLNLHFGLNSYEKTDSIILKWPSGKVEIYKNIEANRYYNIVEGVGIVDNKNVITSLKAELKQTTPIVYPNPFYNEITIDWNQSLQNTQIEITSLNGQIVYQELIENSNQQIINSLEELSPGIYYLKLISNNTATVFILQKI